MVKQLKFCKIEIEKMNFHYSKKTINIAKADIKFFLSGEFAYGKNNRCKILHRV